MRYSTVPRLRKYVTGYGFLSFAKKIGNKYGKKFMATATKTGIDAAKTASKRVVQKTAEATDLIGNKIAHKITSIGKPKEKEKTKEIGKIYFPPEKDNKILVTLDCFEYKFNFLCIKMEFQKIVNFLDTTSDDKDLSRFVTTEWIEVYDQSKKTYNPNKEIRIKTPMLRSDLCNFNDVYIVVEGDITLEGDNDTNKRNKNLTFKNNAPIINCISKISGIKIDNAEDLDVVMFMYNLLEYTKNYRKTTGSLWNYYRDEPSNPLSSNFKSFKCKTNIVGKTPQNDHPLTKAKLVIPLKYLSNFRRRLNIPLIVK